MKAWITKYALTDGIYEVEGEATYRDARSLFVYKSTSGYSVFVYGDEWHTTKESAIAKAETMRMKKIQSLTKNIKKLTEMKFE